MFADKNAAEFPLIGFPSDWRKTLSVKESHCQTDPLKTSEADTQTKTLEEAAVQTDDANKASSISKDIDGQLNAPSLVKFLVRATPMLERELDAAARSRAFDGYALIEEEAEKNVRKLHTLETVAKNKTEDVGTIRVSAVTWSSSGAVVAVAYENGEHDQWCDHETSLNVWNVGRRDFDPSSPHMQIAVATCLTDAKFHPREPSLVLAGGFTGEMFVFSVSRSQESGDSLVASSAMQGHREKITSLQWIAPNQADSVLKYTKVLSAALDGRMILWSINTSAQALTPFRVFLLLAEHLPRALKVRTRSQTEVGVTCTDINVEDGDIVMIGSEAGVVFQGSLASEAPVAPNDDAAALMGENVEWRDPVSVVFAASHRGRVVDIKCSPFHRDVFLTLGSDMEIRVCSLMSPHSPVHVIHQEEGGLSALDWSPIRPLVFAGAAQGCSLRLFDLKASKAGSVLTLRASEKAVSFPLTSIEFNKRDRSLLATGDGMGRVHVWRLTEAFTSGSALEVKGLEALLATAEEEE